jgi:HD-like signal output (HDOD) protein
MGDKKSPTGRLLFVDDEDRILRSLQREFFDSEYEIFTAPSAAEALRFLEKETVDVLITDYKMPAMDGLQLLAIVKEKYPTVNRVILSGYVEQAEVFRALVKGLTTVYFAKPWEASALRERVDQLFKIRRFLSSQAISKVINTFDRIPTLPRIYQEFLAAINRDAAPREIAAVIEKDLILTTRLLHVTNSAFYGGKKNASVERAVMLLGLNAVKDIVLTVSLANQLPLHAEQKRELQEIFIHSSTVNRVLRRIYPLKLRTAIPEEFSSVGITHDIGKLIMLRLLPDRYRQVMEHMKASGSFDCFNSEVELGYGGCGHSELGAYFLDLWNLPQTLIEVALFHHRPQQGETFHSNLLQVTHLANDLVNRVRALPQLTAADIVPLAGDFMTVEQLDELLVDIRRGMHETEFQFA